MRTPGAYAKARIRALVGALEKYHQFQETDSLHRVRVEIKKLKTLLLVLGFADQKFDAHKTYLPLRNIFRKADQVRHPAVLRELMSEGGMSGLPLERLGDPVRKKDKFRADTPFFMTEVKKLGKKLQLRWKRIRKKHIKTYVKESRELIHQAFVPRRKPALWHTARKRVKQLIYLSRLSERITSTDLRFLKELDAAIGSLHDKELLLEFLRTLPRGTVSAEIRRLREQIVADRKSIGDLAVKYYTP